MIRILFHIFHLACPSKIFRFHLRLDNIDVNKVYNVLYIYIDNIYKYKNIFRIY